MTALPRVTSPPATRLDLVTWPQAPSTTARAAAAASASLAAGASLAARASPSAAALLHLHGAGHRQAVNRAMVGVRAGGAERPAVGAVALRGRVLAVVEGDV